MKWEKQFGVDHVKNTDYILTAIFIFSLIGILSQYIVAFIVVSIFLTYFIMNKLYNKSIGEKLNLKNPHVSYRLFPGEETTLIFELDHRSIYPMINGVFQYQAGPSFKTLNYTKDTKSYYKKVSVPLSIMGRRKTVLELPIVAKQRGATRITNINYQFPHLFNFEGVTLKYLPFYRTEVVVFPKLLPVHGMESIFQMIPGEQRMNFSPFEDIQSPAGTRDYNYNDPFHRINWKATARTNKLQTNVYDRVVDMSYIFLVNIGLDDTLNMARFNQHMENILSYTAYLCKETIEKGYNYEIYINTRQTGKTPYLHIPEGEGSSHYINTLERIARIHQQSLVYPFKEMMYKVGQQFCKTKTIIVVGEISTEVSEIIESWKRHQQTIYQVKTSVNSAYITRWVKEVTHDVEQTS